jgi:hypothetical protein
MSSEAWLVILTGLLVIVGGVQAAVLFFQWRLISRQDEHFTKSERAWIIGELGWYDRGLHVVDTSSKLGDSPVRRATHVNLKLTCRNDGRSPAWIDDVSGNLEIVKRLPSSDVLPKVSPMVHFGPLGPGKEGSRVLQFETVGTINDGEGFYSVYIVISYRDIFGCQRRTTMGYTVDRSDGIYPQDALPKRNTNT